MSELMFQGYVTAALWSSMDEEGEPFDSWASMADIAPETLEAMRADCESFMASAAYQGLNFDGRDYRRNAPGCTQEESIGHDFWLTRCGHGAGFWDGDWTPKAERILDKLAKSFGNIDLYKGDDGKVYAS